MRPIAHIRRKILGLTQAELADLTGVAQATVSRWESGELKLSEDEMRAIRREATKRKIKWDDRWFFEKPSLDESAA